MILAADKKAEVDVRGADAIAHLAVRKQMRDKEHIKIEALVFYEIHSRQHFLQH